MTVERQVWYWAATIIVVALVLFVLRGILLPFVAGMVLAYLLDPAADRLQRIGLSRNAATGVILCLSLLLLAVALIVLLPLLSDQVARLAEFVPQLLQRLEAALQDQNSWLRSVIGNDARLDGQLTKVASEGIGWLATVIKSLWSGGMALLGVVSLFVVTPVVAFYLLVDWDRMIARIQEWLPREHADTIRNIMTDIDSALSGFMRGQGTVCLILGTFYAVALTLAGLDFGLLIGLVAGLISFIPYVGSITGLVLSVGVAIAQTLPDISWVYVATVFGIFAFGQLVEGNFLTPRLIGSSVGVHPVALMFALFAFGYLFGFVGMLLAAPIAATIGVLFRFMMSQYLQSRLYLGSSAAPPAEADDRTQA